MPLKTINTILNGFEYDSLTGFMLSLAPSFKYGAGFLTLLAGCLAFAETVFGLESAGFLALLVMMVTEVITGTLASKLRGEKIVSRKFARFGLKTAVYLVLIAVPHSIHLSFVVRGNLLASNLLEWLYLYLIMQIVLENLISILENIGSITGKPKTDWIQKIKSKINKVLS